MQYYIGLDNGGTTTKAALFDSRGKQIGCCSTATKALTPCPEFVERDMEEMWEANCLVIREALKRRRVLSRSAWQVWESVGMEKDCTCGGKMTDLLGMALSQPTTAHIVMWNAGEQMVQRKRLLRFPVST